MKIPSMQCVCDCDILQPPPHPPVFHATALHIPTHQIFTLTFNCDTDLIIYSIFCAKILYQLSEGNTFPLTIDEKAKFKV